MLHDLQPVPPGFLSLEQSAREHLSINPQPTSRRGLINEWEFDLSRGVDEIKTRLIDQRALMSFSELDKISRT